MTQASSILLLVSLVPIALGKLHPENPLAWWIVFAVIWVSAIGTSFLPGADEEGIFERHTVHSGLGYALALALTQSAGGLDSAAIALPYLWAAAIAPRMVVGTMGIGVGVVMAAIAVLGAVLGTTVPTGTAILGGAALVAFAALPALHAEQRPKKKHPLTATTTSTTAMEDRMPLVDRGVPGPSDTTELERIERNRLLRHDTMGRLRTALELLMERSGAERITLLRLTRDGRMLVPELIHGDGEAVAPEASAREGLFALMNKAGGQARLFDLAPGDRRLAHLLPGRHETRASWAMPLDTAEGRLGVLVLDSPRADGFDVPELEAEVLSVRDLMVQSVALTAALREADHVVQRVRRFYLLSRALSTCRGQGQVVQLLLEAIPELANIDAIAIVLERGGQLEVVATDGFTPDPSGRTFPNDPTASLVANAMNHRSVVYREDLSRDEVPVRLFGADFPAPTRLANIMVFPLIPRGLEENDALGGVVIGRATSPLLDGDTEERVELALDQAALVLEHNRLLDENQERAVTDGMTGLPNHRRFQEALGEMLARANRKGGAQSLVSLALLDIDHFKNINDSYGHPMGDEVIRRLATLLKSSREGTDLAARYGGEEFCLALEDTDAEGALTRLERLREAFSREEFVFGHGLDVIKFRCTLSAGIAVWPKHADAKDALIQIADEALYKAKRGGRNRVVVA